MTNGTQYEQPCVRLIPQMVAVVKSFVPRPRTLAEVLTLASLKHPNWGRVDGSKRLARLRKYGADFGHSATGEADPRVIVLKAEKQRMLIDAINHRGIFGGLPPVFYCISFGPGRYLKTSKLRFLPAYLPVEGIRLYRGKTLVSIVGDQFGHRCVYSDPVPALSYTSPYTGCNMSR